jgi:iron complex transport system substrate-binding protein
MRFVTCLIWAAVIVSGCARNGEQQEAVLTGRYAKGFVLEKRDGITHATVFNPWSNARNISMTYYLVNRDSVIPETLNGIAYIQTPVQRVICLSTTHVAYIDVLGETESIAGISGSRYITNPAVRERMDKGLVPDVGYGQNLNFELIVQQKPDVVILYGIGSEVTGQARKLEELGIRVVMMAEYLEETPLGKAEWIKFAGALFEKEELADKHFRYVEQEYNRLKNLAAEKEQKPSVLVGSPYMDAWWVPGGRSYMANLIADAGGDYAGKNNKSHESYVISFENALEWASRADVWINIGNLASRQEIMAADERFGMFRVFNQGKVYNNIKRLSVHGGNDFWESGTVSPHLVLHDLISIFHPDLTEGDLKYYQEIK